MFHFVVNRSVDDEIRASWPLQDIFGAQPQSIFDFFRTAQAALEAAQSCPIVSVRLYLQLGRGTFHGAPHRLAEWPSPPTP